MRERLFRTEKLAAVGRLISGVVNELQAPLATISKMAQSVLADEPYSAVDQELRVIVTEAGKASEIVTRLVSFSGGEQVEAKPVESREHGWVPPRTGLQPQGSPGVSSAAHLVNELTRCDVHVPGAGNVLHRRRGLWLRSRDRRGTEDLIQAARHDFVLARLHGYRPDQERVALAFRMSHDARLAIQANFSGSN